LQEPIVILVAEDDQSIQSIIEETLSDGGFEPEIASSGEEALTALSGPTAYRMLILDIKLGRDGIRGWDVARRARAIMTSLLIIYITGSNADDWAVQGVPKSILLAKPFAPAQLVTAVAQLLNDSQSPA
jgi:DNA-binding response OmpR family regulator